MTLFVLLTFQMYYDNGNLTEEYCLPFLIWSTYFAVKYLKEGKGEHPRFYAFLYGITFGMGAMMRLTNSLPVVLLVAVGSIIIVKNRRWKNLLLNAGSFLAGVMAVLGKIGTTGAERLYS